MNDDLDPVFRALADPTRRAILDSLFRHDGQNLAELEADLPMTRYGVMKHLKVLETAGLVRAHRQGREKRHYLNPVPIQRLQDRWISRYAQPFTRTLTELKTRLENDMNHHPDHIQEIFIRTTPEKLWAAITDPDMTEQYYFSARVQSDFVKGAAYGFPDPSGGRPFHDGEILEIDPPHRLVTTFRWQGEPPGTRVTWQIEDAGDGLCKLTLLHEGLDPAAEVTGRIRTGWARILSGLKTLVETDRPMAA